MLTALESLTTPGGSGAIGAACAVQETAANEKPVTAIAKAIRFIAHGPWLGPNNVRTPPQFHAEIVEWELCCAPQQNRELDFRCGSNCLQGFTSVRTIAAQLNERGILTPRGGAWHPTSAARLLSRLKRDGL
jgi:Recombinase